MRRGLFGGLLFAAVLGVSPVSAGTPPIQAGSAGAVAVRGAPPVVEAMPSTTVPARRVCPVGSEVVVVGDSITEQAAAYVRPVLVAAGYVPQINARAGRTIAKGEETVWGFAEEQHLARCWVIALGSNDRWETPPSEYKADIGALLSHIRWDEPIWWVPVVADGGDAIMALVPTWKVEWSPVASDLLPDGVHLTVAGAEHWSAQVLASLTREVPKL